MFMKASKYEEEVLAQEVIDKCIPVTLSVDGDKIIEHVLGKLKDEEKEREDLDEYKTEI